MGLNSSMPADPFLMLKPLPGSPPGVEVGLVPQELMSVDMLRPAVGPS